MFFDLDKECNVESLDVKIVWEGTERCVLIVFLVSLGLLVNRPVAVFFLELADIAWPSLGVVFCARKDDSICVPLVCRTFC